MATIKKEAKAKRLREIPRLAWSLQELAHATSLSCAGLRREITAGKLKITKVGRRSLVLEEDRLAWLTAASLPHSA